ncbi:hypothetical protein Tco_0656449, partial [Tanacetum coccineum]
PEDTDNAHMPKILDTTTWFRPILKEERPASPEPEWAHSSDGIVEGLEKKSSAKPILKIDLVNPEGHQIVPDISNPLALRGPPGDKEQNRALSISKLKAALYQDFGLEKLVPSLWIESEQVYDIAYDSTHLSYERYRYNYLREIVLRRADYNKYKISEKDFKSLHPNDFENLNVLHIQGKLDHLPKQDKLGIESYQTKLNLEQPNWDASDFPFKEDYTIVFKPRAVIYRDRDDNRKMMRIDEVHKFSDGTLTRIKEKLDFMVKDFKLFKFNKGMEN